MMMDVLQSGRMKNIFFFVRESEGVHVTKRIGSRTDV